jgi:hypothetical protein
VTRPRARTGARRAGAFVAAGALVLAGAGPPTSHAGANPGPPEIPGTRCPAFPADNVWNTPITALPVDPRGATWLASMASSTSFLHPDFGPSGSPASPYGIPWTIVRAHTPFTRVTFRYADQSDRRPYPLTASTPIEGGSDRHAIMVDPRGSPSSAPCTLFETYDTHYRARGRSSAGSGATWNLRSNALRRAGYTSADAAGLPILVGLVNYDELAAGSMRHAIRVTAQCTQQSYLWPARHEAGQADPSCPPMGARFRLDASFTLAAAACSPMCQALIATMKTYGLILADNGSNWYIQGTADRRWTLALVDQLKRIPASEFEVVDESCLMVASNSARALQPGTAAFAQRCA